MARPAAFVGEDRRRAPAPAGVGRVFVLAAAAVLAAAGGLAAFAAGGDPLGADDARNLRLVLDTASAVVALAVFTLCVARRQLAGEAPALWVGAAAVVYGVLVVGVAGVGATLGGGGGPGGGGAEAAGRAGQVATLVLLAVGVRAPAVDTRARPGPVLAVAAALVAVLAAAFAAVPGLGRALTVGGVSGPAWGTAALAAVVACAWLAIACAYVLKGFRLQRLYAWGGALAFALVLAQLADAADGRPGSRWGLAAASMRAIGFVVAALGCGLELVRAYADQRSRLFDSELTIEAAAASDRAERASQRAQRHDVRNAVVAIEGAAVTLERYRDRLTPEDRAALTQVLTGGVERLQGLLDDGRTPGTVDLAAAAAAVVADMGWVGRVKVEVPPGLAGLGGATQTAEAIRLLLDHADKRAPGAPITVAGRVDGTWAVLRVADRGPLVSLQGRRSANARFDAPAAGSGDIGLLVAGRLLRDQGGDLWVEESQAGGAFALCLPLPPAPADGR